MEGKIKPQHDFLDAQRPKETTLTPHQQEYLMNIDQYLEILFPKMEADYSEMHRLPKKLSQ